MCTGGGCQQCTGPLSSFPGCCGDPMSGQKNSAWKQRRRWIWLFHLWPAGGGKAGMNESDQHECHLFGINTGTLPKLCAKWSRAQASSSCRVETTDVWAVSHHAYCAPRKAPDSQEWNWSSFFVSCPYNHRTLISLRKSIKYSRASL